MRFARMLTFELLGVDAWHIYANMQSRYSSSWPAALKHRHRQSDQRSLNFFNNRNLSHMVITLAQILLKIENPSKAQ